MQENQTARQCLWIAALFALVLLATRSVYLGDTNDYAKDIAEHLGGPPFGQGSSLWEFGHLLWRPLGWVLASALAPMLSRLTDWTPFMQAAFALMMVSTLSAIAAVVLWYLLLIQSVRSAKTAFLLALAFAFGHGFLLYARSGCPYIPGLACLSASLFILRRGKIYGAAVMYALAALFWFPFILAGLGLFLVAAAPPDWNRRIRDSLTTIRLANAVRFALISLAIAGAVYCLGGAARGITSFGEARAWYASANHGLAESGRAVRLATGLPRSFLYFGKDGILFKRFLKHDPYAPVGMGALLRSSLWKIAVFYLFLLCFLYELWRRRTPSGWPIAFLLGGTVPVLFFAVFLFEPGQPERYLPALPFLLLAIGWIFRDSASGRGPARIFIAGFLLAVVLSNGYSFAAPRVASEDAASWSRIANLRGRISGTSVAVVTTNQDQLEEFLSRSIFGPVNRPQIFRVYDVVEPGSSRMLQWRQEFAAEVFNVWRDGGEVWVSKRVRSPKPLPDWYWVEGDDPREIWSDLTGFFGPIQTDAEADGGDGFARVAKNEANRDLLAPFAADYKPPAR
jgi:hypothetical protein